MIGEGVNGSEAHTGGHLYNDQTHQLRAARAWQDLHV